MCGTSDISDIQDLDLQEIINLGWFGTPLFVDKPKHRAKYKD